MALPCAQGDRRSSFAHFFTSIVRLSQKTDLPDPGTDPAGGIF